MRTNVDFWEEKLVEQTDDRFAVTLRPRQTVNYRISRKQTVPQIVSSSRHMLQGAVELEATMQKSCLQKNKITINYLY